MELDFFNLMKKNPTKYESMVNRLGQKIDFYEDPVNGDEAEVILVFPELNRAFYSDFFETYDMLNIEDYEPSLVDGEIMYGWEL